MPEIVHYGLIALIILIILGGCSFGHKEFEQSGSPLSSSNDYVIQVDDYGKFWDESVAERALKEIERSAEQTNTIVLIFIHGWHHNAASDNANVRDFAESLKQVRLKLYDLKDGISGPYRESRDRLTGTGDINVIGLYIGWRGKSLPMPFNYLTFWGRKSTAERIGRGELREFFSKLDRLYIRRNSLGENEGKIPFMGMASIGHSFGGQVLFSAIRDRLEDGLINAISEDEQKAKNKRSLTSIHGFGTLAILVNPALEANQYEKIYELNKGIEYDNKQTPLLLVVSAETDIARKYFFPVGRWFGSLLRPPYRTGQKGPWLRALGEYGPHRTHSVELVRTDFHDIYKSFDPSVYTENPCAIINFDLTNVPEIGGVRLEPTGGHQPFSPFLIAYADRKVVIKHSGIFEAYLRNFLNDYVAMAEGKRILLRDESLNQC